MKKYPCKDCIVKLQCVTYCDKLDFSESLLNKFKRTYCCFDCGHDLFEIKNAPLELILSFRCLGCMRTFTLSIFNQSPEYNHRRAEIIRGSKYEDLLFKGPMSGKSIISRVKEWYPGVFMEE